ncbi:hypothetical protein ANCCAN_03320 [Ancylostoma caninum]|uniref:Uncharacterized protein n=1 Tax=Ancylostoma caninum TaxID=29170 RepID=A0A368H618_ANCCA|nr:hypothetical protein ANCCAN_03320 [Ancylostoma caninum]
MAELRRRKSSSQSKGQNVKFDTLVTENDEKVRVLNIHKNMRSN